MGSDDEVALLDQEERTMLRLHAMLKVENLEESIHFYSTLFAAEPTVRENDYAKWMLDDPRVNFSIAENASAGFEHLGIQAETAEELETLRGRISELQDRAHDEGEVVCCYHRSDKTWVTDPQGVSWEAFFSSGRSGTYYAPAAEGSQSSECCATDCCGQDSNAA